MNRDGTDPRVYSCFWTFVDVIQIDSAFWEMPLWFNFPDKLCEELY